MSRRVRQADEDPKGARRARAPEETSEASAKSKSALAAHGPLWITAIATLITALAGAIVLLPKDNGETENAATVAVRTYRRLANSLEAEGSYSGLDNGAETVVLLLRPASAAGDSQGELWGIRNAVLSPRAGGDGSSGDWSATVPVSSNDEYEVTAAIVPTSGGGGFDSSFYDPIREAGPAADLVAANSAVITVRVGSPSPFH